MRAWLSDPRPRGRARIGCLGVLHRHRRLHLPPAGSRKVDEIAYDRFRHAKRTGSMKKGEKLWQGRIERCRQDRRAALEVSKIRGGDHFVLQDDMVAPSTLKACRIPALLDLPLTRGKPGSLNLRPSCFADKRLAVGDRNAEPRYPVGVLASTGE